MIILDRYDVVTISVFVVLIVAGFVWALVDWLKRGPKS